VVCILKWVSRGIKLLYLPAYSPDFNPIEESFSFVKGYIRRHGARFRAAAESDDEDAPILFLYEVLNEITPEHARGWFHHSGYL
jgi:hypothetical protein